MSWLYSQALVEEYSQGNFSDGESCAQLNAKPTPHKFWRNDKTMEFSKLSQFGLTSTVLTEDRGEAVLTSYLAAFPARTLASPEKAKALPANDPAYGDTWRASFAKYDPHTHLLKTAQCSLFEDSTQYCATLPRWGSMQNGVCWEQTPLAPHTSETEYGCLLPTPNARDWKDTPGMSLTGINPDGSQRNRTDQLARAVYAEQPTSNGSLNPTWVEWLMGWPLGWTDLKQLEMDKCHSVPARLLHCSGSDLRTTE